MQMATDNSENSVERTQECNRSLEEYFVRTATLEHLDFLFSLQKTLSAPIRGAADVFCANLVAVYVTASAVPVFARQMAYQAGYLMMLGVTTGAHAVLSDHLSPEARRERIQQSLQKDVTTSPWKERLQETVDRLTDESLARFLEAQPAKDSASHILRQCVALTWSAFEVLASDLFTSVVNGNPKLCSSLLRDERTKKLYQLKELGLMLEEYDYDPSHHMGDVLLQQCRMDDINAIRTVYDVLFTDRDTLRSALNDARLWRLYKIRNLIVHRAAVVDELFLRGTGLNADLGSRLRVTPRELEDFILLVAQVGKELLSAASAIPEWRK